MPNSTILCEDFVSLPERRLRMAMKIATLTKDVNKYQRLAKLATESGDVAAASLLEDLYLGAETELADLKRSADKYQQLMKLRLELEDKVKAEKVNPVSRPEKPHEKSGAKQKIFQKAMPEPKQAKLSESDWVDQQAKKLMGSFGIKEPSSIYTS